MVGTRTVVPDPAAELAEDKHQYIVRRIVLLQVGIKVGYALGQLSPELGVGRTLVGMGVISAVLGLENPGPYIREQHLGDTLQVLSDRARIVLDA